MTTLQDILNDPWPAHSGLTERERQAATWAARGYTNEQVADLMRISTAMATAHIRFAKAKLGVSKKGELTQMLLQRIEMWWAIEHSEVPVVVVS